MRQVVISDIDGVLTTEPMFNPPNVGNEIPISMSHRFLTNQKMNGAEIIYVTGRSNAYRKETKRWLKHHKFPDGQLLMRVEDKDPEVKGEAERIFRWDKYYQKKCATVIDIVDDVIRERGAVMYIDDDKILTNCMKIKYKLNGEHPEVEIINPYEKNDIFYFYGAEEGQ